MTLFLEAVLAASRGAEADAYPWTVPAIGAFRRLDFTVPVTFLMGENGCGKSTLLEAIAIACDAVAVGDQSLDDDATLAGPRILADRLTTRSGRRASTRLFFRAEDSFGFTRRVQRDVAALDAEIAQLDASDGVDATRRSGTLAANYVRGQRGALTSAYGADPHAFSHGETFLNIVRKRTAGAGLYFLDEPETPLSPTRVMALLTHIHASAAAGSQYIIATHSPILAALPGAAIRLIDGEGIRTVAYDDLEHVRVTRDFLNAPERYLRHLLEPTE